MRENKIGKQKHRRG
uniref:Uncharacterized protein n=1 Tax=Arundo donax TaxID=35708 RepID=A0A0A8ZVQ2_ARUDO